MANGMFDLSGWLLLSPEEATEQARRDREEWDQQIADQLECWPLSQRRPRCLACGAFMPMKTTTYTRCKVCNESYDSLQ